VKTLSGISVSSYNASRSSVESVLRRVIAKSMIEISSSDVSIKRFYDPVASSAVIIEQRSLRSSPQTTTVTHSNNVTIQYKVTIDSVQSEGYETADDAYSALKSFLIGSVYMGLFTNYTQTDAHRNNVVALHNVEAKKVPSVSDYDYLMESLTSAAAIAILVISILIPLCFCCVAIPMAIFALFFPQQFRATFTKGSNTIVPFQPQQQLMPVGTVQMMPQQPSSGMHYAPMPVAQPHNNSYPPMMMQQSSVYPLPQQSYASQTQQPGIYPQSYYPVNVPINSSQPMSSYPPTATVVEVKI
jgi:hypothetical protein